MKNLLLTMLALGLTMTIALPVAKADLMAVTYRDFLDTHADMESTLGVDPGIVENTLGNDKIPVYAGQAGNPTTHGQAAFDQWYRDTPGINDTASGFLDFVEIGNTGVYRYSNNAFFPLDNQLLGNQNRSHNYHFTMEMHSSFTYQGGETFHFTGDDDVWVFIDDQLAIDLGGVHGALSADVDLDTLGLTVGQNYDFDLFFAERHTTESNFLAETSIEFVPVPGAFLLGSLGLGFAGWRLRRRRIA